MRYAVVLLLLMISWTAPAQPRSEKLVWFTLSETNRLIDSLRARGDWMQLYAIQSARVDNCRDEIRRYVSLDSLSRMQLAKADSVVRNGFSKERTLLNQNALLEKRGRERKWWGCAGITIGVILTLLLK